jgi:3-oxoacyl-[acyl-carrier-protein] synthase II
VRPADEEQDPPASGPISDFDVRRYVDRKGLKYLSRTSHLACAAAAGVAPGLDGLAADEVGLVFGSAWASLNTIVRFEREAHVVGPRFVDPMLFAESVANVPAGQVSIVFGWAAVNATVSAGSASGTEAIRLALDLLDEGRASAIVAGGGDEFTSHVGRVPAEGSRHAVGREGACLVVVEAAERAAARGAPILGRLAGAVGGFAGNDDAGGLLGRLLEDSSVRPNEIDLLVVGGASDRETAERTVARVRKDLGRPELPVIDPKATLGECWAAGGPLGLVIALEAMRRCEIPGRGDDVGFAAVRRAIVLDATETGHVSALLLTSEA